MWKGFQKPKRLAAEPETLTDKYGKFSAQPFERGWGTTVGNALRRALLSSIEGAAITAVKIEGVLHEFSPIPGVVEDATDIILNLKTGSAEVEHGSAEDHHAHRRYSRPGDLREDRRGRRYRRAGQERLHRHRQRRRKARARDAREERPRICGRRPQLRRRPAHRLHSRSTRCTRRCAK